MNQQEFNSKVAEFQDDLTYFDVMIDAKDFGLDGAEAIEYANLMDLAGVM